MKSLVDIQTDFQAYIFAQDTAIIADLNFRRGIDYQARIGVYRNGYYLRLVNVLSRDYSILAQYIGEDAFVELAQNYIDAYPSTSYSIAFVGRHFVEYLASCSSCSLLWRELAAFEDCFNQAMLAPSKTPLSLEDLSRLNPDDWPSVKFCFHPSVSTINYQYPVALLWAALQHKQAIQDELQPETSAYIVWRRGQENFYSSLTQQQYLLACEIEAGHDFATLCARLAETYGADDLTWVAETIREWVAEGIFIVA